MAPRKQTKTEVVGVRFTPFEKRRGEALARDQRMTFSEYLRELLRREFDSNGKAVA